MKHHRRALVTTMLLTQLWLLFWCSAVATEQARPIKLEYASPADSGFSAERLKYIDEFYAKKVSDGEMAGIVILISRHGKIVHFSAIGYSDLQKKQAMRKDEIFRLYSMSKPITSVALMMLYEEGRFEMHDPLSKCLPELANLRALRHPDGPVDDTVPVERPPTIEDVLRHTSGFTHGLGTDAYGELYTKADVLGNDTSLAELVTKLAKIPLRYQPETKFVYSLGPDIAARLVEVLSGMKFDEFLDKRLFRPLGMTDAGFWVPPEAADRLATVYWAKDGKLTPLDERHGHPGDSILEQPSSVNSYTVNHRRKGGSFGMVSTAEDYWRFAQMMLNGGELNGVRILSPSGVRFMTRNHIASIDPSFCSKSGIGFGLGFADLEDSGVAGYMASEGTYFWDGAASTHFWVDPKEDMVVVAMTQLMDVPIAVSLDSQLRTLVYSALMER